MPLNSSQEIGENVTITDISQLQSITPEQAKKIKSLRIENQDINMDFLGFFYHLVTLILYIFIDVKYIVQPCLVLTLRKS